MSSKLPWMVRKTAKGIIVNQQCDDTLKACYYKDGNYPDFPADPSEIINTDYMTTAEQKWAWDLTPYRPDRVHDWID